MKISSSLQDFLYDKNYFITLFENKIHIFRFKDIIKLTSEEIILTLPDFKIKIKGKDLTVIQMNKEEILIAGFIQSLGKIYE